MNNNIKVPDVSLEIFGKYESRFGYKVYATNNKERDYVLYCVAKKIVRGKNKGKCRVWEEIRDLSDNLLQKRRGRVVEEEAERVGSFCYEHAINALCEKLGNHLRGEKSIEEILRKRGRQIK